MVENLVTVEKLVSIVPPAKTLPGVIQSILIGDRVVNKYSLAVLRNPKTLHYGGMGIRNIQDCSNVYFWPQRAFNF